MSLRQLALRSSKSIPFVLACLLVSGRFAPAAEPWSSFQNGGIVAVAQDELPTTWTPADGIAWQTKLAGTGQSSPVILDSVIYVTSISGKKKEALHVQAIDFKTGKELWHFDAGNSSPEESTGYVSHAAPTPVCDSAGVIALFEGGNLVALTPDGKKRWERDLVADYGAITSRHGLGSSLEQNPDYIFVWMEREKGPYLAALSKSSGETKWKSEGLGATAWSSPRLVPTEAGEHLVCSASGKIAGFDPASGKRLWTLEGIKNNTTCTPMPVGSGKFLIGASDGRGEQVDAGAQPSSGLVQIARKPDGSFAAEFVWKPKKASASFGSPIAYGEDVYFVNRVGVLFQLDLETGAERSNRRVGSGSIWATPLVAGGKLYLFGYRGTTSVLSLADMKEIAQNRLWEGAPASADGDPHGGGPVLYAATPAPPYLILRRGEILYAVGPKPASL